jgi:iron complex transport system substrate-binding protein
VKELKRVRVLIAITMLLTLLSGCKGPSVAQPAVETREVTDDLGRNVTVPVNIKRVVSLAPNLTENIFAIGAGDRLVGVTTFCDYPEQAKAIAKIGDTMNPNIESIIALKPDVVFVSTASQIEAFMKTLEQNGIAVFVSNPTSLETLYRGLVQIGFVLGTHDNAKLLVSQLVDRQNNVRNLCDSQPRAARDESTMPRTKVFVQISREPLFTIGKGALLNDVVQAAGGRSVTADVESAYPKLSKETAVALDPDVIILSESDDNREANEVFKNSPAVRNGRVYKINADLISRPGPRLVDALEIIARDLGCAETRRSF